jgi:hypothetical protein
MDGQTILTEFPIDRITPAPRAFCQKNTFQSTHSRLAVRERLNTSPLNRQPVALTLDLEYLAGSDGIGSQAVPGLELTDSHAVFSGDNVQGVSASDAIGIAS